MVWYMFSPEEICELASKKKLYNLHILKSGLHNLNTIYSIHCCCSGGSFPFISYNKVFITADNCPAKEQGLPHR